MGHIQRKIANFISGGYISWLEGKRKEDLERLDRLFKKSCRSRSALKDIINMSTPCMANIGKRMAKRAEKGLTS